MSQQHITFVSRLICLHALQNLALSYYPSYLAKYRHMCLIVAAIVRKFCSFVRSLVKLRTLYPWNWTNKFCVRSTYMLKTNRAHLERTKPKPMTPA
jgi:hypothetical protein